MKKYFLSATAVLILTAYSSMAQDNKENSSQRKESRSADRRNKMNEYDEIIIKKKDAIKDKKVVIEIKDDEIIVDGKPIEEFVDDEVSVQKRGIKRYNLEGPASPFRNNRGNWSLDESDLWNHEGDRAFLGVMTEGTAGGTRIIKITENSAAAKAGLKKDDIITKINNKDVYDQEQLADVIRDLKPEDKITITYKRDGKENKTTAILGKIKMPVPPMAPIPPMPPMNFNFDQDENLDQFFQLHGKPRLGIKAQDTEDGKGVKVLDVDEGSAADKAGIKENDVITSFEGKDVNSAEELAKASRESKEKTSLKVELKRDGKQQTIEVKIPKKLKTANL